MPRSLAAALIAAAALTGCYSSTEPATEIGAQSARLNARGTADDGPAYSFFKYQRAFPTSEEVRTPELQWPAGASGPFSQVVTGLEEATTYLFSVCGGDEGEPPACAQQRSFTTRGPDGRDSVKGFWRYALQGVTQPSGRVDAESDPQGGGVTGSLSHYRTESSPDGGFSPVDFLGFVTCVSVDGQTATVGAVGIEYFGRTDTTRRATSLLTVEGADDPSAGLDRLRAVTAVGVAPPSCDDGPATLDRPAFSSVVVTDN